MVENIAIFSHGCHSYKGYHQFSAINIVKVDDKIAFMRESVLINKT